VRGWAGSSRVRMSTNVCRDKPDKVDGTTSDVSVFAAAAARFGPQGQVKERTGSFSGRFVAQQEDTGDS